MATEKKKGEKDNKNKKIHQDCAGFGPEPEAIKKVPTGTW